MGLSGEQKFKGSLGWEWAVNGRLIALHSVS